MPQPTLEESHVNRALSDIAVAYMQDEDAYVADKVFPVVPVQKASDFYWTFNKGDFFRDEARPRADATESAGGGFRTSTSPYQTAVIAFHKDIGDQLRANADFDIEEKSTRFVTQRLLIKRERDFMATYMQTGVWGTDVTGVASGPTGSQTVQWNVSTSDPIADIDNAKQYILSTTGQMPNTLTIGYPVLVQLRRHPGIIERIKYTSRPTGRSMTTDVLAEMFDVDRVLVARSVYNAGVEGAADSFNFIAPKAALLSYAPPTPSLDTPSAGYIFAWTGFNNGFNVRVKSFYMPPISATRIEADMAYGMSKVSGDVGYFFSSIVA